MLFRSGDMFFFCSPCTGGSVWQRLNLSNALQDGRTATVVKLVGHWDLHWRLWANFERVALHCKRVGAACVLEWPAYCEYWEEPAVISFLERLGFVFSRFDGCMYGLTTRFQVGKQTPIRKPWMIACLNTCLPEFLNLTCDGSHSHAACQGQETLLTQGHTPSICKAVQIGRAHV